MAGQTAEIQQPTLFLSGADLELAFAWEPAMAELRRQYAAQPSDALFPNRTMARGEGIWLRTLSGIAPSGGMMGTKVIAASMRQQRASYLISLFDQETMELAALIDGNAVTGFRTAATTALALDALARPGPIDLGVLGSGFEARNHVRALASARALRSITVFSPNPESRANFADDLADLGAGITGRGSAQEVVEAGPDILLCAARSHDERPLFDGTWLKPGMTVGSIGSTLPEQREVDPTTIERASLIVADMVEEVIDDTGDMIAARRAGVDFEGKVISLSDLVAGAEPGRKTDSDIALYKSVGGALQDIAVATMCLGRARELGLGIELPDTIRPVLK